MGRAIVRIGKELSECLLTGYSKDYSLGLGVSLVILWECANGKKTGEGQGMTVPQILQWVKDLQDMRGKFKEIIQ